jgi:hypothetical protein
MRVRLTVCPLHLRVRMWKKGLFEAVIGATAFLVVPSDSRAQGAGSCPTAGPAVVASGLNGDPSQPQVDDQFVYYLDNPGVTLFRVPKTGGTPTEIDSIARDTVTTRDYRVAVDASRIYFMDAGIFEAHGEIASGAVRVYDKTGALLYTIAPESMFPQGGCHLPVLSDLALGPTGVLYWIQAELRLGAVNCPIVNSDGIFAISPGATEATLIGYTIGRASRLLASADHQFWKDDGGIWTAPGLVDDFANLDPVSQPLLAMARDASSIYYTRTDAGNPGTFRIEGAGRTTKINEAPFLDLVTDGTFIFGNVPRSGSPKYSLDRMKPNGHGMVLLARSDGGGIAVDETYVYYFDNTTHRLLKTCKLAGL